MLVPAIAEDQGALSGQYLPHERCLADAGLAGDEQGPATPLGRLADTPGEHLPLLKATDEQIL